MSGSLKSIGTLSPKVKRDTSAHERQDGGDVFAQYCPGVLQLVRSPTVHAGPPLELEPPMPLVDAVPAPPVEANGFPHATAAVTIRIPITENVKLRISTK